MRLPLIGHVVWDRAVLAERKRITKAIKALPLSDAMVPVIQVLAVVENRENKT